MRLEYLNQKIFLRQMVFLKFGITPRGKISQKLRLFCPEFRENPSYARLNTSHRQPDFDMNR